MSRLFPTVGARDLLELEKMISRRNSIAPVEIERVVKAVRLKRAMSNDESVDVADLECEEDPWYLEARVITLEAALEAALEGVQYRLPDLRRFAYKRDCTIRLPGVCCNNPETTVLCHVRRAGVAGAGRKPCDLTAFIGCYACHSVYDRVAKPPDGLSREAIELAAFDAVARTHELYRVEFGFR